MSGRVEQGCGRHGGDVVGIHERRGSVPGRDHDLAAVPDVGDVHGREVLHEERGTHECPRQTRPPQPPLQSGMRDHGVTLGALQRQQDHVLNADRTCVLQRGHHLRLRPGEVRRAEQEHRSDPVVCRVPRSRVGEVKCDGLDGVPEGCHHSRRAPGGGPNRFAGVEQQSHDLAPHVPRSTCDQYRTASSVWTYALRHTCTVHLNRCTVQV